MDLTYTVDDVFGRRNRTELHFRKPSITILAASAVARGQCGVVKAETVDMRSENLAWRSC
jgi:hypothetical protein